MSKFSLNAQEFIVEAYDNFGDFILKSYSENTKKVISKLKMLETIKKI